MALAASSTFDFYTSAFLGLHVFWLFLILFLATFFTPGVLRGLYGYWNYRDNPEELKKYAPSTMLAFQAGFVLLMFGWMLYGFAIIFDLILEHKYSPPWVINTDFAHLIIIGAMMNTVALTMMVFALESRRKKHARLFTAIPISIFLFATSTIALYFLS